MGWKNSTLWQYADNTSKESIIRNASNFRGIFTLVNLQNHYISTMKNNHRTFVTGRSSEKMALINGLKSPRVRKMPRKKKKEFIKKNGRDAYEYWCKFESYIKQFLDSIHRKYHNRCFEKYYLGDWQTDYGYGRQVYVNNSLLIIG